MKIASFFNSAIYWMKGKYPTGYGVKGSIARIQITCGVCASGGPYGRMG